MSDTSSDSKLIGAFLGGDSAAAELIVERHWDDAFRVAYLMVGDRGTAEEIAQDSLLAALRAAGTFDRSREFRPWLHRIAANRAVDRLRQRRSRPELLTEAVEPQSDDSATLAREVAGRVGSEELRIAVMALDPDLRAAIVLRFLLDYEPKEIAELLGAHPTTVRTRIHRGLVRLRASLAANEGGSVNEQTA